MPNWKTHLEISKELNKVLNYNEKQYELFTIGSILPDVNNGYLVKDIATILDHRVTHFSKTELKSYECFYNIYKDYMDNPLIFGYFTHLFTDYNFNNDFYTKAEKRKLEITLISEKEIKQQDFKIYNNIFIDNTIKLDYMDDIIESIKIIKEISIIPQDLINVKKFLDNQEIFDMEYQFYRAEELDELKDKTTKRIEEEYIKK